MQEDNKAVEIVLTRSNAAAVELVAKVWGKSVEEVLNICFSNIFLKKKKS